MCNSISNELRQRIADHLIQNGIDTSKKNYFVTIAAKFNTDRHTIRNIYKSLVNKGVIFDTCVTGNEEPTVLSDIKKPNNDQQDKSFEKGFKENVLKGEADISGLTNKRIRSLQDLIEFFEIDTTQWEIASWEANKWEVGRKDKYVNWSAENGSGTGVVKDSGKIHVEPLYQVKAKLVKRKVSSDPGLQKDLILKELIEKAPTFEVFESLYPFEFVRRHGTKTDSLLEICLTDAHFGLLAWGEETGENFDLKIASSRAKQAVSELLGRVGDLSKVERILLPVGNDLFNVDSKNNATTNGTPQDVDVRYMKMVRVVKDVFVDIVNSLSIIAPVDVIIVPGNHDRITSLMLGEILHAYYNNNDRVVVNNSPKLRKYYKYGKVGLQLTHGDEEKHEALGLIFATEESKLWADTVYRFCQLGHFHKNKTINYLSVDEHQGFQVQILPSLSGTGAWTYSKGYMAHRQAKAFIYHKEDGLIGEFTHTVKNHHKN